MKKYYETQEKYVIFVNLPASLRELEGAVSEIQADWDKTYGGDPFADETIQVEAEGSRLKLSFSGSYSLTGRD